MSRAIVTGMIATYPVGGVVWDYGQYALGLEDLGFDVWYLEDTGWEAYDPRVGYYGPDYSYGVDFLRSSLEQLSPRLGRQWHVRAMDGTTFGVDAAHFRSIVAGADVFVNVSGGTLLRDEYMVCPHKVFVDSDPGWNHFVNFPKWDAAPGWQGSHGYRAHDHFFTYAERIGAADCTLPTLGIEWSPTRPPVVLDCWRPRPPGDLWTTVMTWDNFRQPIEGDGVRYGTKEREFEKVEGLPGAVSAKLQVAVGGSNPPTDRWRQLGWSVESSEAVSRTADDYRSYVERSRAEFSVAKNVYVDTRSGWFSCRSVCYLAASRPVVVQDTGFSSFIPTGQGLLSFTDCEEAAVAVGTVQDAYDDHAEAAREIAATCFGAEPVLGSMLRTVGLG